MCCAGSPSEAGQLKVLVVSSLYYPNVVGGAEMSTQKVAESLTARGHGVVVATLNPRKQHEVAEVNGVRVHYLPVKNLYFPNAPGKRAPIKALWHAVDSYNPFMAASLGRILDTERPDVVNTHNICGFSASVWRAVKKRHLPLVHTVRDHYLVCSRSMMFHRGEVCSSLCLGCRVYRQPRQKLSRLVDVAIGISRSVLEISCQYGCFPESEKMVVYNAFDPVTGNGALRVEKNGAVRFGYIGRLHPSKGTDMLVRSFLELPDGKAKLLIAGKGSPEYEDDLRRLINGQPAIQMLGFVAASDFLPQVDVSVVPSLCQEAAGRVVLESMAHCIPVIGSCRGGISEQMGEGTGWFFDPDEPGALTQAMRQAIDSPGELKAMGEHAGERARHFSTEAMVNGYLQAYTDAIERSNKNT